MVKLKIGILGFGYWGKKIYQALRRIPECEITVVCDKRKIPLDNKKIILTDNYKDLLRMNLDGIIIATPNETHFSLAFQFLLKGYNLFVEKPLATSFKEAEKLINLAAKRNLNLFTGHILLYHPLIDTIKKILENKKNLELKIKRTNKVSQINKSEKEIIYDLFPHDIALLLYFFKKEPKIKEIALEKSLVEAHFLIDNEIKISGVWGKGTDKERTITFFVENKKIVFDGLLSVLKLKENGNEKIIKSIDYQLPLSWELSYFLNSLKNKRIKEKIPTLKVMAVLDKIEKLL
uniref:Gfo/Idh/MocA family oxidoreductase n=1 Tax=candidate division WOR-3 bacterium TaxID=2052148 RepID=A0A7V3ZUS7_UNCW3